jgi:hypothetical protein
MNIVGLFRELYPPGLEALPSLRESSNGLSDKEVTDSLAYLARGLAVFDVMQDVIDPLDPTSTIPGGSSLESDGRWIWRSDLKYFVRRYRVTLPPDFLRHVEASKKQPQFVAADCDEVIAEYSRHMAAIRSLSRGP